MPKTLATDKSMKRGDIDYVAAMGVSCVKWMDNRSVLVISNFLSPEEKTIVKRRKAGTAEKVDINCPEMIAMYNKYMGGVDLIDQLKVTYQHDRKSKTKFYLRLFFDMLDMAVP